MLGWLRRRWAVVGSVGLVVLIGVSLVLLWPERTAPPREREYGAFTACLLTDDRGLAGEGAKAAWDGMQKASLSTLAKTQYLAVNGPQTPANAAAYFNALGLQKCQMIIAVGAGPVGATAAGRSRFPEARYLVVGESSDSGLPGVSDVSAATITSAVEKEMTAAVDRRDGS
ncbi:hypothetical protein [Micromonospora sp. 067-2]|uniref:hypothetical protein n=1 Tax=Micromonospora sp. 067-2 TaxID=2789270 RepID=UPI00397C3927